MKDVSLQRLQTVPYIDTLKKTKQLEVARIRGRRIDSETIKDTQGSCYYYYFIINVGMHDGIALYPDCSGDK